MDLIQAIILGIIQGLAEWLPISSEAMVTLAGRFFAGLEYKEALGTAIWLHTGTMFSAIIYFYKDIIFIVRSVFQDRASRNLLLFLAVATVASAVTALPLLLLAFSLEIPEAFATIAIGAFLIAVAFIQKERKGGTEEELTMVKAAIAGLIQGLAVLPGLSRSGLTISALLGEKFPLKQAFRLSFLMSIPVTFGAQIALPLVKDGFEISLPLIVGAVAAASVGLFTIKVLMEFAEKVNFFKATLTLGILVVLLGLILI